MRTRLQALVDWYQQLSPESLTDIHRYYHSSARFKDPFNTVQGRWGILDIFKHMFEALESPRFVILQQMLDGEQAFLTWDFHFQRGGKSYCLHGGSYLCFGPDGLVTLHRDYWDSAEELLHKLPLIGPILRALRRKLSVHDDGWQH